MSVAIEDYEHLEELAAESKRRARWGAVQWSVFAVVALAGMFAHIAVRSQVNWPVEPFEALTSILFWLCLLVVFPLSRYRRQWLIRPHCPACSRRLRVEELNAAMLTRACPACQHVFRSRKPPEAQAVALDAEHLPRVWLAHEVEPPAELESAPEPVDATNPYAPSRDVSAAPLAARPSRARVYLWMLWTVTFWPIVTLFRSRESIIAQLPTPPRPDDAEWQAHAAAFVRSQRRAAWFLLPWTAGVPAWLFFNGSSLRVLDLLMSKQFVDALMTLAWDLASAFLGGLAALFAAYVLASLLLQRRFQRWLQGSPPPAKAQRDEKTGYYGLRLRFTDVTRQDQLPTIRFRYRQKLPGELVLRVVDFSSAHALEKKLHCAVANAWQTVELDLRALVRQSDPDFFGDELHFTGDPAAELEIDELQIVRR